ncbi:MAG: EamA family transporter [Candidatus Geothermarchaeales archaeon]
MIFIALAISTAFFYGLSTTFVRRGLVKSNFISAAFVVTIIGNIVFWSLTLLFVPLNLIDPVGVLLFALAGVLAPGLTRISYILGMERLGASTNASVHAINPVFGATAAIILLHEQPTIGTLAGTFCVICGAVLVATSIHSDNARPGGSVKAGLAFSLFASITYGLSFAVRKMGLNIYSEPIIGIALGYTMALCIYTLMVTMSSSTRSIVSVNGHAFRLFWKAGVFQCTGWIMAFYAVMFGDVVVVNPLIDTQPLFVFLFAHLYLKELETITPKLVLGTIIVIIGVTLISIY